MMFFFSSRRRHTRYIDDWSSDVCSSDLDIQARVTAAIQSGTGPDIMMGIGNRSEERRVGKECRSRWSPETEKKKMGTTITRELGHKYTTSHHRYIGWTRDTTSREVEVVT